MHQEIFRLFRQKFRESNALTKKVKKVDFTNFSLSKVDKVKQIGSKNDIFDQFEKKKNIVIN